jgi:hypothetical protein
MEYIYRLAGIQIACSLPFSLDICAESREFLELGSAEGDLQLIVEAVDALPPPSGLQVAERYYDGECTWFSIARGYPPYAMTRHSQKEIHVSYLKDQKHRLDDSPHLCDILALERFLPLWDTMILHCSFLRINGQAILFSGPSGIGKSTQAALWERHTSAELCNGDRAALRLQEGQWSAHGIPYAGSSRVYRNASAPCRAIVMLGQASENRMHRLSPREAFVSLYPEVTIHHWEKNMVERVTALLSDLVCKIPVYRLDCLPDEQAVQLLYQEVFP